MSTNGSINVIIPMGGLGSRFAKEGYAVPKPLVNIMGRPMISWLIGNLHFEPGDVLYIALQREIENEYFVSDVIRHDFPDIDIRFTFLDGLTRGAAETLYKVTQNFTTMELSRRILSLDCDTLYFSDVLQAFRSLGPAQGCSCYFIDKGTAPIFSYIELNPQSNCITNIAEKVAISRNANTGGYGFPNSLFLNKYVTELLKKPLPPAGEFYTSALISAMIEEGSDFQGVFIEDFECVGTPRQLLDFFRVALERRSIVKPAVVILDLETLPTLEGKDSVSDEALIGAFDGDIDRIVKEAADYGVEVIFSLESGFQPEDQESKFGFASKEERESAKTKHALLRIDDNIQKAIGWYLL